MLIVERANPREVGARALLEASHKLMTETFPPEENYFLDIEELCSENIRFFAAREDQTTLGTGALYIAQGYGEVKSMFTSPEARGKGVGAALLRQIEDQARQEGLAALKLETGEVLSAAIRLYERHGFTRCEIFGDYQPNTTSVYMEKPLDQ
ncbi:MAG: GNAT family N-acetyltransferase [Pseudomonadota bacterium]